MGQRQAAGLHPFSGSAASHWLDAAVKLWASSRDLLWAQPLILHRRKLITVLFSGSSDNIYLGCSHTSFWLMGTENPNTS